MIQRLIERLIALREQQANAPANERADYEAEIAAILAILNQ